jgi:hypothetical protein
MLVPFPVHPFRTTRLSAEIPSPASRFVANVTNQKPLEMRRFYFRL